MKQIQLRRPFIWLAIFTLFAGAMFIGFNAFSGSSVMAQSIEVDDDDDANEAPDVPITGEALDLASAAALDYLGEGVVTETEIEDEDGYYEVEVTLDDGSEVDVHLDEQFNVLGHEND